MTLPYLEWDGPDEDGDFLVVLGGVPNMHLVAHGKTIEETLGRLGEAMMLAAEGYHSEHSDT